MKNVYFIDQDYFLRFSQINGTTDRNYIEPAVRLAQLKHVRAYLGKCLFDKLVSLVENQDLNDETSIDHASNSGYKTLLNDYVQDVTLYWALSELYPYLSRKISKANLIKEVPQNAESLSGDELATMVDHERSNAQHFTDLMIKYLNDLEGNAQIAEWENCDDDCIVRKTEIGWGEFEIG